MFIVTYNFASSEIFLKSSKSRLINNLWAKQCLLSKHGNEMGIIIVAKAGFWIVRS